MLQCGSQFLHPGAEEGARAGGQAGDALEAFSRVAAAVVYSRWVEGRVGVVGAAVEGVIGGGRVGKGREG